MAYSQEKTQIFFDNYVKARISDIYHIYPT